MLINEFWKIPFLRLIIPFIFGIVISYFIDIPVEYLLILSSFFIILTIVYRPFLNHNPNYHNRWIFGVIITAGLFCTGAYFTRKSLYYNKDLINSQFITGFINKPPKTGSNNTKLELKVDEYQINNIWQKSEDKILVNIEKDSLSSNLKYGDLILIKGNLKEISNAGNPSEFDYKEYLSRKHLHYKSYQKSDQWALLGINKGNPLFASAFSIRERMLDIYLKTGIKGEEFGLLAALTLGTMDYLSDEIIEAYSNSGAMHVLSVSGLHVGIILIVLNQIFFFLRKKRYQQILQAVIILSAIWFYALLTGLSPSVNRSAAMISFVIIGKVSNKKPSTYNSVAASAFILLIIEPLTLFDVGFQLSFLAVIAIIFFHHRIYSMYEAKSSLMDKIWSLTSVSIAAQIGTSILSVFYFHQFPVYALLSNLFVVPVSFVVMVLAIGLLLSSFYFPLAKIIAFILSGTITFLNGGTKFVENLPLSTIEPISLNNTESVLLHLSLILLMIFIVTKHKKLIYFILISFILAFGIRDYRYFRLKTTDSFTVFNVQKKSAISIIENGKLKLFTDSILFADKKSVTYLTSNIMADRFITDIEQNKLEVPFEKKVTFNHESILRHLIIVDSLKVLFLNRDFSRFKSNYKLNINYIVLSNSAPMDLEPLQNLFNFDMIIADASVSKWKQDILKKDCLQSAIPFYNVSESGAFIHLIQK